MATTTAPRRARTNPLPTRYLTLDQVRAAFAACPHTDIGRRDAAILALAYGCGLRSDEIRRLNLDDLDWTEGELTICGKGGRWRTIPLPLGLRAYLSVWLASRTYLLRRSYSLGLATAQPAFIISRDGNRISNQSIRVRVKALLRAAGVDRPGCSTHSLRHAFARHTLEGLHPAAANALRIVQELLGHESLRSTGRYLDVDHDDLVEAIRTGHPFGRSPVQLSLIKEDPHGL